MPIFVYTSRGPWWLPFAMLFGLPLLNGGLGVLFNVVSALLFMTRAHPSSFEHPLVQTSQPAPGRGCTGCISHLCEVASGLQPG